MCAPGSKEWRKHCVFWYRLLARGAHIIAGFALLQFLMAFGVQYEVQTPAKTYASTEVLVENEGLQRYVAALASHDLHDTTGAFAIAAFDLDAPEPTDFASGHVDWEAFMSPAQQHVHALVAQCPVAWGSLFLRDSGPQCQESMLNNTSTAPATLWLTGRLVGAGERPSTALRTAGNGGDNDTGPALGVGGASASSGPASSLLCPNTYFFSSRSLPPTSFCASNKSFLFPRRRAW